MSRLRHAWQRRGALALVLWPLSQLYRVLQCLHHWCYRSGWLTSERLPVPVWIVGNVIAGGAGKTPVTLALVEHLKARGWRPGIISRGYGRTTPHGTQDCRAVTPASLASEVGDEPLLLARSSGVPVYVARQRAQAGRALLAAHPDTNILVCDDGLQHWALARDAEICVFNDEGAGNGWLLPAGPLREPWPRSVDWVLHAGRAPAGGNPHFAVARQLASHGIDSQGRRVALASLRGQPLHALAGIARPKDFFAMLRAQGLTLAQQEALPDHYDFNSWQRTSEKALPLICTEKDAVKLWPRHPHALAVPLTLRIAPEFFQAVDQRLASLSSKQTG